MAAAKTKEIKYRLKEIKNILQYPDHEIAVSSTIECLVNGIEQPTVERNGKTISKKDLAVLIGKGKAKIPEVISAEENELEKQKTDKILAEVERILTKKKLLAH